MSTKLPIKNYDDPFSNENVFQKHGSLFSGLYKRCLVVAISRCGKTNIIITLLTHPNGLHFENSTLGNTEIIFEGPDIIANNLRYPGIVGLYELFFEKQPIGYTGKDLDQYKDILKRTIAYRRNFNPEDQMQGTRAIKYETVIKPYLLNIIY